MCLFTNLATILCEKWRFILSLSVFYFWKHKNKNLHRWIFQANILAWKCILSGFVLCNFVLLVYTEKYLKAREKIYNYYKSNIFLHYVIGMAEFAFFYLNFKTRKFKILKKIKFNEISN